MYENLRKNENETLEDYESRVYQSKDHYGMTWNEVASILNRETGRDLSPDTYRKRNLRNFTRATVENLDEDIDIISEMRKERVKLSDERSQINALIRRISREETIKEIGLEAAKTISNEIKLAPIKKHKATSTDNEAILLISDWHYGIEIDNTWNFYNPEVARKRVAKLRDDVLYFLSKNNIDKLHVLNLGDLIAGRIHLQLRINSRIDTITQIIEVSEILAEFLHDLSEYVEVHYYDTLDNHSRIEPNLSDSLQMESLARITTWYLKERVGDIIEIHNNRIAPDIITFDVLGHKIVGVHGDKDKPGKAIDTLTMMTQQHFDLVCTAHLHHFSCEEKNETVLVSNSSLMGTDEYAERLRLSAKPSQSLIICSKENPVECLYKINVGN